MLSSWRIEVTGIPSSSIRECFRQAMIFAIVYYRAGVERNIFSCTGQRKIEINQLKNSRVVTALMDELCLQKDLHLSLDKDSD